MKINFAILLAIAIFIFQMGLASAQIYQENFSLGDVGNYKNAMFAVQTLKYEPYPVSAGDSFDLWIKVQNVGQNDAKNAEFSIASEYPFSVTNDSAKDFGNIPGTINAYKYKQAGETEIQVNQVIMKFRVRVADDAPDGESTIKLQYATNKNSGYQAAFNLPIEIAKTKTDFDVVPQDSATAGFMSFSIANTGSNPATAIVVSIEPQSNLNTTSTKSSIIGNLDKGDFTTVNFQIPASRNLKELNMKIAYTDIAGVRNTIEKTIPISSAQNSSSQFSGSSRTRTSSNSSVYLYLTVGIVLGIVIVLVYQRIRKKKLSK